MNQNIWSYVLVGFCAAGFSSLFFSTFVVMVCIQQFRNILKQSGYTLDTRNRIIPIPLSPMEEIISAASSN